MNDCSNHKKEVCGISDMKELANLIGDLHYETLTELFDNLTIKFQNDCIKDREAGRTELAQCLLWIRSAMSKAGYGAKRAWEISKPFMQPKKPQQ
jgi:hypothetical protein